MEAAETEEEEVEEGVLREVYIRRGEKMRT